jgi:hypothetical protein
MGNRSKSTSSRSPMFFVLLILYLSLSRG